jgi:hypothetical protein
MCRLLRLAILFASRRRDDLLPMITLAAVDENLTLTLPHGWMENHPLGREMVEQECQWQSYVHWPLLLNRGWRSKIAQSGEYHARRTGLQIATFFSALFRLGNVSPAAEALNVSQPTGSLLLKKLREHFDDPLFVRIGQRMVPTPRADDIAQTIFTILQLVDNQLPGNPEFNPKPIRVTSLSA